MTTSNKTKEMPQLETERLFLRGYHETDAKMIKELAGNCAIADVTTVPHPYLDGMAERWIATQEQEFQAGTAVTFAIVQNDSPEHVLGTIGLRNIKPNHQAEMAYWIGEPYWGGGYAMEAACAVLRHAFQDLQLQRVYAHHLSRNPASGRVMQKLGMQWEGRWRKHAMQCGVMEDLDNYGILKEEWEDTNFSVSDIGG